MIRSKLRPVVIPQLEHARLAGTLASLWGNANFDPPPVDPSSWVAGVSLHDRGYGHLDRSDLFQIPESEWLEITRRGFYAFASDPVADLIVKYHLKRLAGKHPLADEMAQAIQSQLLQHGFSSEIFERMDRITNLCDRIALAFSREAQAEGQVSVFPRNMSAEEIHVRYQLDGGVITIDPWPFSSESVATYVIGYESSRYPDVLDPVVIPARLVMVPSSSSALIPAAITLRVARPTDHLDQVTRFYMEGLGMSKLGAFEDHEGFDGVILGMPGMPYHLEFTRKRGHEVGKAPTKDHLLVLYLPEKDRWMEAVDRMKRAGYEPVAPFNPYWERAGRTFEDPDGYRVVLQSARWER